jgi:outer membrane protein assembly factor BamB
MWRTGGRWRRLQVWFGVGVALALLVGGLAAYRQLDPERHASDAGRLAALAQAELPGPGVGDAGDWPQWRGPNRDGLSRETGLRTAWPAAGPRVLWRKPVGRGFSSVAVAGGRLYTMEEADAALGVEAVVCLDAATGNENWRFRYPNRYEERFGSGPRSTPAVDGGFVYAVGPTGIFHCLRADTGQKVWRHDLREEFAGRPIRYGVSFSPLVEGDLVYAMPGGPNGNAVAAFDKRTGTLVWKALDDEVGYSSPVLMTAHGVRQVLFFTNSALVSLSPRDGRQLWRYPWQTESGFNIATPIVAGNYVFISSAYGKGCALLEVTVEADNSLRVGRVYEHNRMRNYFASSVRFGEHIYGLDMTDLVCLAVRTGEVAWREKGLRSFRKGSLLIADGHIILLGEDSTLTLARATPDGYQVQASHRVSQNKCWTVPALARGKLYIRDESSVVCLDLKE